jgi:spermidine dehydrogenase
VRALVKGVAPRDTMEDVVLAPFDYARLDVAGAPTRIRLSATVLRLANTARGVDIIYARAGKLHRLAARHAIWAGWGMMLPHVMPEMGAAQKTAMAQGVKQPLVYARALIRNWTSFARLGVHEIHQPSGVHCRIKLDYPVSMGGYRFPTRPEEPMVVHMVHVPEPEAKLPTMRERARTARAMLLGKPFAEYEAAIRGELARLLGPGGFDADRDIAAITVNRWSHGYAYTPNDLDDDETASARTVRLAARRIGRVAIAGSDAGWDAYAHVAIDEAHRAVRELLG